MGQWHDVIEELRAPSRALRDAVPEAWSGHLRVGAGAMADGAVSRRIKEAAALAMAAVKQCDGCIAYHARGAAQAGTAREEVAELLGVALLMDGGPAAVYGPRALEAFDEFAADASGTRP